MFNGIILGLVLASVGTPVNVETLRAECTPRPPRPGSPHAKQIVRVHVLIHAKLMEPTGAPTAAPGKLKECLEWGTGAEELSECGAWVTMERVGELFWTTWVEPTTSRLETFLPILVKEVSLLLVTQDLVGFCNFFEFLFSFFSFVFVRMIFECKFPVSFLDLIVCGALVQAQCGVVVLTHDVRRVSHKRRLQNNLFQTRILLEVTT
uniref:Uncharacterized protein n=1 Tax=Cacopsylla melanoneura TaxID=428564 RepID=A0A8D8XQH2_9HEMI